MTDEIFEAYGDKFGHNATISTFAAAGPKTYALLITDKRTGTVTVTVRITVTVTVTVTVVVVYSIVTVAVKLQL